MVLEDGEATLDRVIFKKCDEVDFEGERNVRGRHAVHEYRHDGHGKVRGFHSFFTALPADELVMCAAQTETEAQTYSSR